MLDGQAASAPSKRTIGAPREPPVADHVIIARRVAVIGGNLASSTSPRRAYRLGGCAEHQPISKVVGQNHLRNVCSVYVLLFGNLAPRTSLTNSKVVMQPEHKLPIPSNATKSKVHAFAEQLASRLPFGAGDPIDALVSRLGGKLVFRSVGIAPDRLPESIVVESPRKFTIFVPTMTSAVRDRFTIAHELGHLFLHYPIVAKRHPGATMMATRWVDESDPDQKRAEWEANWFAAAFLMPSTAFGAKAAEYNRSLPLLASHFGVSTKAAEIRLQTLSL